MLISFEGIDGCGKTTLMHDLYKFLQSQQTMGLKHEGWWGKFSSIHASSSLMSTDWGSEVRKAYLSEIGRDTHRLTKMLVMQSTVIEYIAKVVDPLCSDDNPIILCDRLTGSGHAYQGSIMEGERERQMLKQIYKFLESYIPIPHITVLCDVPLKVAESRKHLRTQSGDKPNRIDNETRKFHRGIRDAYMAAFNEFSTTWIKFDLTSENRKDNVMQLVNKIGQKIIEII